MIASEVREMLSFIDGNPTAYHTTAAVRDILLKAGFAELLESRKFQAEEICRWFGLPRRSWYYRSVKAAPKLQEHLVTPIKNMIEENPSFGYRTVAALLGFNKNTVQRIFQLKGLASSQASGWVSPPDPGPAFGGLSAQPTLGDGPMPDLGWSRWLVFLGAGD